MSSVTSTISPTTLEMLTIIHVTTAVDKTGTAPNPGTVPRRWDTSFTQLQEPVAPNTHS